MDCRISLIVLVLSVLLPNTSCLPSYVDQQRHLRRPIYTSQISEPSAGECVYPCSCPLEPPDCNPGVVPERDDCGCCLVCPRQLGEPCDFRVPCDVHQGLACRYHHGENPTTVGVCREANGLPCVVYNKTYEHGETFTLDCKTQCACQNGTYGCSSLCPQEHISPRGSCTHPRLVDVPGQCCKEWLCDGQAVQQPPECQPSFSRWSRCSTECGTGVSRRRSNLNAACTTNTETRLCQTRRCDTLATRALFTSRHHHVRKGHECKATHRLSEPVRLEFGPCRSRKLFRPKYCGSCPSPGVYCEPLLSTTVKVDFVCSSTPPDTTEQPSDLVLEYLEPGEDMWRNSERPESWSGPVLTFSVQWILKCRCSSVNETAARPTAATGEVILHRVHRTAAP